MELGGRLLGHWGCYPWKELIASYGTPKLIWVRSVFKRASIVLLAPASAWLSISVSIIIVMLSDLGQHPLMACTVPLTLQN